MSSLEGEGGVLRRWRNVYFERQNDNKGKIGKSMIFLSKPQMKERKTISILEIIPSLLFLRRV